MTQDQFTKVNGLKIRYWQQGGQGSPVLLIHGLGGFVENWQFNINALAKHHRVFAIDLPGFGQSDKPKRDYTVAFFMEVITGFIKQFELGKTTLIGNSLGGGAALMLSIHHPELVDKIILACPAGFSRKLPFVFKLLTINFLNQLLLRPSLAKSRAGLQAITRQHDFITDEYVQLVYGYANTPGTKHALISIIKSMSNFRGIKKKLLKGITERLHEVKAPTLIIWGKDDPLLPLKHAKNKIPRIPSAELVVLEDCGHMPQCEYPAEFNQLAIEFLDQPCQYLSFAQFN